MLRRAIIRPVARQRWLRSAWHALTHPIVALVVSSVICPAGVINAIWPTDPSLNQILPSGPGVMSIGKLKVGVRNSVMTPSGVIRATWLRFCSVNHRLPSGPTVMEIGWLSELGIGKERC